MISMETATIIAERTEGKLSAEDVINLATYGAVSPMELAPEVDDLVYPKCMCGEINCPDAYAHMTSGC